MYIALIGAFGFALTAYLLAYSALFGERVRMAERVDAVVGRHPAVPIRQQELSAPFYQRVVKPALAWLGQALARNIPSTRETSLVKRLNEAGNPGNLAPREFIVIKYLLAGGIGVLFWCVYKSSGTAAGHGLIQGFAGIACGWLLPDFFLNMKIRQCKDGVEKSLPDVLDLLTISVEAGLGFDGAMMKVAEKSDGLLAGEFLAALQEIKMGKPRREALRDMAGRLNVDDFSNFVGSVVMADQLGIPIGNVLRLQSREMREKRRQRVEEMAMKVPVKMLIPMVVFIFPAVFIVLLGPAIIQIMRVFAK